MNRLAGYRVNGPEFRQVRLRVRCLAMTHPTSNKIRGNGPELESAKFSSLVFRIIFHKYDGEKCSWAPQWWNFRQLDYDRLRHGWVKVMILTWPSWEMKSYKGWRNNIWLIIEFGSVLFAFNVINNSVPPDRARHTKVWNGLLIYLPSKLEDFDKIDETAQ